MKLLKINDIYVNPEQIVTINAKTGYMKMSNGITFQLDENSINQIIVYISSGTLESDVETAKKMMSQFKENGLLDSAALTKLGKFLKKIG
ncbi:MAG: hypothetical protein LKF48_07550 [Prevotella sp.]|jgi:Flp pilus assembly CpaF family ATPase|nr:hypothetical protein [Prevotella sp.]MCH4182994.1 hypothetical protein [Prevotella sp.]